LEIRNSDLKRFIGKMIQNQKINACAEIKIPLKIVILSIMSKRAYRENLPTIVAQRQ
jgi:hypothetical protein